MRRPFEPVSTWMSSIVAQLLVPAWQTVTLVVSMLRVMPGETPTVTGCTLGVVDCGTFALCVVFDALVEPVDEFGVLADGVEPEPDEPDGLDDELPPPPPQPTRAAQTTTSRAWKRRADFMAWRSDGWNSGVKGVRATRAGARVTGYRRR
ncbi:hypothetical protein OKW42_007090 [Paraburkholderia sp. WC7.3d]